MSSFTYDGPVVKEVSNFVLDDEGTLYVRRNKDGRSTVIVGRGKNAGKVGTTVYVTDPSYIPIGETITISTSNDEAQ